MSRDLPSGVETTLESEEYEIHILVTFTIDGDSYRYTDGDVPLVYNSNRYEPTGVTIENVNLSLDRIVSSVVVKIVNLDSELHSKFVGGTPQGEDAQIDIVVATASATCPLCDQEPWSVLAVGHETDDGAIYFGEENLDDTWQIAITEFLNKLAVSKRVDGSYVKAGRFA